MTPRSLLPLAVMIGCLSSGAADGQPSEAPLGRRHVFERDHRFEHAAELQPVFKVSIHSFQAGRRCVARRHRDGQLNLASSERRALVRPPGNESVLFGNAGFSTQPTEAVGWPGSLDSALLHGVYDLGRPFSSVMRIADRSAWPVFVAAVPGSWLYAVLSGGRTSSRSALSMTLAEGSAAVSSHVLKRVFGRPRPYVTIPSIVPRSRSHREGVSVDPYSFPSGHAAMSFSIAMALALESERWYVTVPAIAWASGVTLSRVWLGVHYPSDVLAGAILGSGLALLAHVVATELIDEESEGGSGDVGFSIIHLTL